MGPWRLGCQLCCDFWGIAFSRIARVLLMTFADSEASRILRSHLGAEDGGGKPKELQRGGDSTHEGCRGWASGWSEQGGLADRTKFGKFQAYVTDGEEGGFHSRLEYLI